MRKIIFQKSGMPVCERMVLKANLHIHSTVSDGFYTPQQVIGIYKKAGFDVLAFSDHCKVNRISEYDGEGMTLICGVELHPYGPHGQRWHILALGVPEDFSDLAPASGQAAVNSAVDSGAVVFCAHPYWCGFTPEDVMSLERISGIEVYNTSCRNIGKEFNMYVWDACLDAGKSYNAVAVDDFHGLNNFGGGWTMIFPEENNQASIIKALKEGYFYSTQGPEFTRICVGDGTLEAEFSPCTSVILVGRYSSGKYALLERPEGPGSDAGESCRIKLDLRECPSGFFRIQLRDADGNYAWSNPIFNSAAV